MDLIPASHEEATMTQTRSGGQHRGWCRARTRRAGVLAITAGLALLTTACGGSPSATSTGRAASASISHALAYARCVRAHGVPNFPDPDSSGQIPKEAVIPAMRAVGQSRAKAATQACMNLNPAGQAQAPLTSQQRQDYLRAAACMRSHGFASFPDPVFSGGSVTFNIPAGIDTSAPRFTQARQSCVRLIPAGLPYRGSHS
jgi:hypothetical protein